MASRHVIDDVFDPLDLSILVAAAGAANGGDVIALDPV
jgi:hypothetical protein